MSAISAGGWSVQKLGSSTVRDPLRLHLMQHTPTEIKEKLLKAVDKEYNVVDMGAVVEVITILEKTPITKEALESTRLGKYVNELRRKTTNESLAKRAKHLVRQWRHLIVQKESCPASSIPRETINHQKNGLSVTSRLSGTLSPGLISRDSNVSPGLPKINSPVVSPYYPVGSGSVANSRILSVSPAVSLASSEKSNTSPSLVLPSSHVVKPAACPRTPPISQTKSLRGLRPESPNPIQTNVNQVLASESVPKTHVANKRLRKDSPPHEEEPPPKKIARPNGDIGSGEIDVVGDCSRDSFGVNSEPDVLSWDINIPPKSEVPKDSGLDVNKKRGHKRAASKGQKSKSSGDNTSSLTLPSSDDIVKEKLASVARMSKVKTTQELLADLQAKNVHNSSEKLPSKTFLPVENKPSLTISALPSSRGSPSDALEVSRNKTEHIEKFLRSQPGMDITVPEPGRSLKFPAVGNSPVSADVVLSEVVKDSNLSSSNVICYNEPSVLSKDARVPVPTDDSIDKVISDVLKRLPPIDYSAVTWDEIEPDVEHSLVVSDSETLSKLSTEQIEGVNGNFSHLKTSDGVPKFCEWHEPVSRTSYGGEVLGILPYVIID